MASNQARLHRVSAILPLVFSALAFALVMANIVAGVRPQPDETTSAHIWQLLILAQIPLLALFVATANWRDREAPLWFAAQILGIVVAFVPVWIAGY